MVTVVKLDRLARSSRDLQNILHDLQEIGCGFVSLGESWCDTTTDVGRLVMTIMGGIAEFERNLIRKRCEEGIQRAKRKGTKFGRPLHSITANAGVSPSATLPARPWRSWRASTGAVKRRFGGRCNSSQGNVDLPTPSQSILALVGCPLIVAKMPDHDICVPIFGMGRVVAI